MAPNKKLYRPQAGWDAYTRGGFAIMPHMSAPVIGKLGTQKDLAMNQEDIDELEKLLNQVINAYTKSEGKKPLARLEFLAAQIKPQVSGYAAEKLSQAVGYAKSASGSVQNKEHWKNNANQAWYLFEREVNIED